MPRILIAGATGFIGQALLKHLEIDPELSLVALSRKEPRHGHERLEWRKADLFSLKDITEAMRGCDQVVYLVHSMLPSASLVQGTFYDMDLILADNLARAAKLAGVRHLVYLGGLIPADSQQLSWHLKSRLEVEEVLQHAAQKVTVIRAGMVIGRGGSSFAILRRLVNRLPVMLCPGWTKTPSQPVDLDDLLRVLHQTLVDDSVQGKSWDVGSPEVLSYQEMMLQVARTTGSEPIILPVQAFSLNLSRFWVTLVTGAPKALVYPLVQSLRYPMVVQPHRRFPLKGGGWTGFQASIDRWSKGEDPVHAFETIRPQGHHLVRSVQRLTLPAGKNASWLAAEYFRWLPRFFSFLIRVELTEHTCRFYFVSRNWTLLRLEKSIERSTPDRQLLYIRGGLLARGEGRGRLEFREVLQGRYALAAIHDFYPRLPWFIYKYTQAVIHLIVMQAFARHLKRPF